MSAFTEQDSAGERKFPRLSRKKPPGIKLARPWFSKWTRNASDRNDCRPYQAVDFDWTFLTYLLFGNWERRLKVKIPVYSAMSFQPGLSLESIRFLLEREIQK
jgi:hypothetical protein